MTLNEQFVEYCKEGNIEKVKEFLKDPRVDPSTNNNDAIKWVSYYGLVEVVELFLKHPKFDPSAENNYVIRWASAGGHVEIVELLLNDPRVDPYKGLENPSKECKILIERFIKAKNMKIGK